MAETNFVVVHYANGKLKKGTTVDFFPNRQSFHIIPPGGGPAQAVNTHDMKALFFVRSLQGRPKPIKTQGFARPPGQNAKGKKIAVRFADGELLCGYTLTYVPGREGFFMFPADEDSNNLRIFVVAAATVEVRVGPEADALAERIIGTKGAAAKPGADVAPVGPGRSTR